MAKGKKKFEIVTPRGTVYAQASKGGKVSSKLEWNPEFAPSKEKGFSNAQEFVDSECIRRMNPETPRRTGVLIKSATLGTVIAAEKSIRLHHMPVDNIMSIKKSHIGSNV